MGITKDRIYERILGVQKNLESTKEFGKYRGNREVRKNLESTEEVLKIQKRYKAQKIYNEVQKIYSEVQKIRSEVQKIRKVQRHF